MRVETLIVGPVATCCYLLSMPGRDDCVLIDPGAQAERIRQAVGERRVAAILLTHGHFDHIGAVAALKGPDTALVIHEADAPMLGDPQQNASWLIGKAVVAPQATRLTHEGDEFSYAGISFTVLHTPGHTPGGVCYRAEDGLFSGDTRFRHGYGRVDLPGGSMAELCLSLKRLEPLLPQVTLYPGHEG